MTTQSGKRPGRRVRAALLAAVIVAALLAGLTQAPAAHADASFNQRMLELVNGQRAAAGVAPLRWSTSLGAAAEDAPYSGCGFTVPGRAMDMGQRNYFSHSILGCPNQNVFDLLNGLGVVSSSSGENIAWLNGTTDAALAAQRLTNDLMASPPHRANILNADYTHVGIGSWRTSTSQTWTGAGPALTNVWIAAQIFGRMAVTTAPAVGLNPTSVSFGDRTVGTTSPAQAITVNNQGDAALSVAGASLAGPNAADFRISANSCATVPAGSSCTVHVAFAPGSEGAKAATLSVSDNAAGSPHSAPLAGNGLAPAAGPAGVPVDVQATGGDAQISVSWSAAASGAAVEEYAAVLWDAGGYAGQTKLVCAACFSAGFTGLTNGRTYIITIHGRGPAGWGSPGASAWTMVAAKPAAPANVVVTQGNAQMTATWAPPTTPGAAIDGYGMLVYDSTGFTGAWRLGVCHLHESDSRRPDQRRFVLRPRVCPQRRRMGHAGRLVVDHGGHAGGPGQRGGHSGRQPCRRHVDGSGELGHRDHQLRDSRLRSGRVRGVVGDGLRHLRERECHRSPERPHLHHPGVRVQRLRLGRALPPGGRPCLTDRCPTTL